MNPAVSSLQKAEKELIVDFPLEKVKDAIMEMFKLFPNKYLLRENDINEVFNTYHFPIVNVIKPGIVDMTLEKVEDSKTRIRLSVTNPVGSTSSNSILAGIASDYLLVLSKVLTGESVENIKETVKNTGCLIWLLIGGASIGLMSFMFL